MKIMKTFAKLSLLALAGFSLVACGLNRPGPDGRNNKSSNKGWGGNAPSEAEYVPPAPKSSEDDGYVEPTPEEEEFPTYRLPGEKEQPEEEPNVLPFEWEGFTPADPQITIPEPGADEYTPASVMFDLLMCWFSDEFDTFDEMIAEGLVEEVDDDVYYGYVGFGTNLDSSYLQPIFGMFESNPDYFPEYLQPASNVTAVDDYPGASAAYEKYYLTPDGSVVVEAVSNIYSGKFYMDYYTFYNA